MAGNPGGGVTNQGGTTMGDNIRPILTASDPRPSWYQGKLAPTEDSFTHHFSTQQSLWGAAGGAVIGLGLGAAMSKSVWQGSVMDNILHRSKNAALTGVGLLTAGAVIGMFS